MLRQAVRGLLESQRRERDELIARLNEVRGLIPLLMKRRNGIPWNEDEQRQLLVRLKALNHLSPYLLILVLPGSFLFLPALAWWLDRRRLRRNRHSAESGSL